MLTTTTATVLARRVSLRSPQPPRPSPLRLAAHPPSGAFCSPAGLRREPWLARLRRALAEDLFVLHFQPIISLADGRVTHHEALLRLADRPDGRLTAPTEFLPAAERHGLVRDIDRMVLGKAIRLLARRPPQPGCELRPALSINLSALSVTDEGMLGHLERGLAERGVDPELLVVEVTETAAIGDMAAAKTFCAGVRSLGCGLALDDFGAGFGSFQYLKHLPFSHLKIDGEFIRGLPASRTDQLVVRALVGVARGMGRRTIAEFVGDEPTLVMLRSYGVDYAQGFGVGPPQAAIPLAA